VHYQKGNADDFQKDIALANRLASEPQFYGWALNCQRQKSETQEVFDYRDKS